MLKEKKMGPPINSSYAIFKAQFIKQYVYIAQCLTSCFKNLRKKRNKVYGFLLRISKQKEDEVASTIYLEVKIPRKQFDKYNVIFQRIF